jgi:hypothetical protein
VLSLSIRNSYVNRTFNSNDSIVINDVSQVTLQGLYSVVLVQDVVFRGLELSRSNIIII